MKTALGSSARCTSAREGRLARRLGILMVLAVVMAAPMERSARAASSAAEVCSGVARKAGRTLWSHVRDAGDATFCRKSWVPGKPDELAACALWSHGQLFASKVKNAWNAFFQKADAEWATWGPRSLAADFEQGTIRAGFKRTFFGVGTAYSKSIVDVAKEGGSAEAFVTVCTLDYDGKVTSAEQRHFTAGGSDSGPTVSVTLENHDNRIVGVVVDTPLSLSSFEYRARLRSEPLRNNLGAAKGVADLHVHQLMNLGFAGRMYWGLHAGPEAAALAPEAVNPTGTGLDLSSPANFIKQLTGPIGVDANMLFAAINPKSTDEGFFRYGGAGFPTYRDWPHHADRSHQQVYLPWLKEAHLRGVDESHSNVNLIVVSPVNNNILCSVAKLFDPFGNVPIRDSTGRITGWESASWGCSDHENVQRQLIAMHEIEKANPWYRIAMSPWHARQIIADGDLAVVVSMETDKPLSGEGNNYGNWEQQLDFYRAMGLSTMQIVHESDSKFCGAALHRNMMTALEAVHFPLKSAVDLLHGSTFQVDQNRYNMLGVTTEGRKLVAALQARNMPIDLAHGSLRCRRDVMELVGRGYGLYDSHTKFRKLLAPSAGQTDYGTHVLDREQELLITEDLEADYLSHQVLIGLRPTAIDVYDAPNRAVKNDCPGSANSFAQVLQYANDRGFNFAYGTDFNTGLAQLGPRFGAGRCWAARRELEEARTLRPIGPEGERPARAHTLQPIAGKNYYTDGMATYGFMPEMTIDLADNLKAPGAGKLRESAEAYLVMWERAYPPANTPPPPNVERPKCKQDQDCPQGQWCNGGIDIAQNKCEAARADGDACPAVGGGHACRSGRCIWGHCTTPGSVAMGGACYEDGACREGKCSAIDGARGICVCKADSDCGPGTWCDAGLDFKVNACRPKLAAGQSCGKVASFGNDHKCRSGQCSGFPKYQCR